MASSNNCHYCGSPNHQLAKYCSDCGRPLQATSVISQSVYVPTFANSATGQLILNHVLKQQYRVISLLGQGGMGAVYKAEDQKFGNRLVAIKELSTSSLQSAQEIREATDRFEQEGKLLANLMHPNLPRIYDYFTDIGRSYLVMDFIEGETLEDYLAKKGGKLPTLEALDIGIKLCSVLDYLHSHQPPIIFRDLKPANIMIANNGIVYLIDFGIARLFKQGQSKDTIALGSPGYAAPEQYQKQQTTPRVDIYALGAIMHQLLSGDDPTIGILFNFASLQLQSQPSHTLLVKLIEQMLEMKKEDRPASVSEVKQKLQDIATQLTAATVSNVPSKSTASRSSGQRASRNAASVAAKQVISPPLIGTIISTYTGHSDGVRTMALSPDGQHVVSASDDVQIWDSTAAQKLFTYTNPSLLVYGLSWSYDGGYIVSGHFDRTVQVWDASTGNIFATYRNHTDRVRAVAWAYDSKYVASSSDDNTVCIWSINSSNKPIVYSGHKDSVFALAWSPNGKQIVSGSDDNTVQVWDAFTGKHITTYRGHKGFVRTVAWSSDGRFIASGSWDQTIQIWSTTNGQHIYTYRGHKKMVNAVVWFPDSRRIASGSRDKEVHIWDSSSPKAIFTYRGHTETVNALACSFDGQRIVSASDDGTVQVWQAQ
jgi:WD40 repeat protein/predicted Ser/Thr protein kinase